MNNDEFKHIYPIERAKSRNINITNIGQILLICLLFIIIFIQITSYISELHDSAGNNNDNIDNIKDNNSSQNVNLSQSAGENDNNYIYINENQNLYLNNPENINHSDSDISETIFILGENNGKLAILSPDRQTVYEIFDVYINTLPDYDKILLQNGIKIKTPEELYSLLEDYNS